MNKRGVHAMQYVDDLAFVDISDNLCVRFLFSGVFRFRSAQQIVDRNNGQKTILSSLCLFFISVEYLHFKKRRSSLSNAPKIP